MGHLGAAFLLTLSACGAPDGTASQEGDLVVVATNSILGDVVGHVVGTDAVLHVLVPRGADPHGFEPSARQAARLRDADLVVANGLGLETTLDGLLGDVEDDGVTVLSVAEEVDPIPFGAPAGEGHLDPHFWTDPLRVAEAAHLVAQALDSVEPGVDWNGRARAYERQLRALHAEIEEILEPVAPEQRRLVTNHEVFGYFARRYDFTVVGVVIPGGTTLAEPDARAIEALAREIRRQGVRAVFGEATQPDQVAETLRREAGLDVELVTLFTESLGPRGSGAGTYTAMMRTNARRIAAALD